MGVLLRGQLTRFDIADERKMRMRAAVTFKAEGRQLVTAPMPGKVTAVLVKEGATEENGANLLTVE